MSDTPNRILLFVHFNPKGAVSEHVLYTLKAIRPLFSKLVFISNSPLDDAVQTELGNMVDDIMMRENRGFDFGAWKDAIDALGWDVVCEADSLTLMNDSCFGPLFDLQPLYEQMQRDQTDFWGMTDHRPVWERIKGLYRRIPYHLQSYFLVFHKPVLTSKVFRTFWKNVKHYDDIWDAILKLETRLTRHLQKKGFRCVAVVDTTQDQPGHSNWAHYQPELLIDRQLPLIKVKSFLYCASPTALLQKIQDNSPYPVSLIQEFYPDLPLSPMTPLSGSATTPPGVHR